MRKGLALLLLLLTPALLLLAERQFYFDGYIKDLKYLAGLPGNNDNVIRMLEEFTVKNLSGRQKQTLRLELTQIAQNYYRKGDYEMVSRILIKLDREDLSDWRSLALLAQLNKERNSGGISLLPFRQLLKILGDFRASFFLVNRLIYYLFLALMVTLFFFVFFFFLDYFEIIFHNTALNSAGLFELKRVLVLILLLIWPLFIFSWGFFPFIIGAFCWFYLDKKSKKSFIFFLVVLLVFNFILAFKSYLEKSYSSESFKKVEAVFNGRNIALGDSEKPDDDLQIYRAYNMISEGDFDGAREILESVRVNSELARKLTGIIHLDSRDYDKSISYYRDLIQAGVKDFSTLNNLTLALVRKGESDVYNSFANAYPQIGALKNRVYEIVLPQLGSGFLFRRLWTAGEGHFSFLKIFLQILVCFLKTPLYVGILLFFLYLKFLKGIFPSLGSSIYCSKCRKIVKRPAIERANLMCDDCYQLFLMKDPIFFDAKILKEKELQKAGNRKNLFYLLLGVAIPGIALVLKKKNQLFLVLYTVFAFFSFLAVFATREFLRLFAAAPLVFSLFGVIAVLGYLVLNICAIWQQDNAS